jgi:hypothetical protein
MSDKFESDLLLTLKPSKRLKKMVVFIHTLALGASMANALAFAIKISFFAIIWAINLKRDKIRARLLYFSIMS